jgi:type I restriction enzyme S subunit
MSGSFSFIAIGEVTVPAERAEVPVTGYQYRQLGVQLWGKGAYERETIDGSQTKYNTLSRVEAGDIVVNKIWARNGSVAVVPEKLAGCYVSTEFPTFLPKPDKLIPEWFHWITKTKPFWEQCDEKSRGTIGQNRIRPEKFLEIKIPLPPVEEQHRIVARIEELMAKIEEARGLRWRATDEIETFMARALNQVFNCHTSKMTSIGEAFSVTTGGTPSRANPLYWEGEINWVSSGEVAFNRITDTKEKITELGLQNSNARIYPLGTVLIAMIGQGKTRGQCALLECRASTNQNVAGIHVYQTEHLPEYVYWWLYSRYQMSRSAETGTAQPALNAQKVRQMPIPLPSPEEQRRIVAYLDNLQAKVDALKKLQAETAAELDALLPSILDKAFKGEL